jgi:glycine betaine/choline ABC-type transport system substrate-binding protein
MRTSTRSLIAIALSLLVLTVVALFILRAITVRSEITIASKNFTESRILVEIMAQTIESNAERAHSRFGATFFGVGIDNAFFLLYISDSN